VRAGADSRTESAGRHRAHGRLAWRLLTFRDVTFVQRRFLVTGDLLSRNLQHRVGWSDYVTIA
jgi:hypothetical protein